MSNSISQIAVDFVANTAKYSQGLAGMQKQTKAWSSNINKDTKSATGGFGNVSKSIGVFKALGGALAGIGITAFLKDVSNLVGKLSDLSDQLNIDTEDLQKFESLFQKSGNTLDDVAKVFSKLQKSSIDAAEGNKNLNDAFVKLGINAEAFNKLNPTQQVERFSKALVTIENPAERAAIAQQLLGETSRKTLAAFTELGQSGDITKFSEGVVIASNESIAAFDNLLDSTQSVFTGLKRSTIEFIGNIIIATDELKKLQKSGPAGTTTGAAFMGMGGLGTASSFTKAIQNANPVLQKSDLEIAREEQSLIRQRTAADRERTDALALQAEAFRKLRDSILSTVNPSAKYAFELDKVNEIVKKNNLSEADRQELIAGISQSYIFAVDPIKKYGAEVAKINADKGLSEKQKADNIRLLASKYEDIIDPANQYRKLIEDLDALNKTGIITDAEKNIVLNNIGSSYRELYDPTEKYLKLQKEIASLPRGSNVDVLKAIRSTGKEFTNILNPLQEFEDKFKELDAFLKLQFETERASLKQTYEKFEAQGTLTKERIDLINAEGAALAKKYNAENDYIRGVIVLSKQAALEQEVGAITNDRRMVAEGNRRQELLKIGALVRASEQAGSTLIIGEGLKREMVIQTEARAYVELNKEIAQGFQFMSDFTDQFSRAIVEGQNFGDSLKNAFQNILKDVLALILRMTILQGIMAAIGLANPVAAAAFGAIVGIPRANGGPVMAGENYRVGERGPEQFVPSTNGYILPNDMGPSETVIVNQTINVQTGVAQTVRAEMNSLLPKFKQEAMAGVLDAKQRGGNYSKLLSA
jgi:hypothetical protein